MMSDRADPPFSVDAAPAGAPGGLEEAQTAGADQTASDADQTAADADQTAADADLRAALQDDADAARDQQASDEDQASADRLQVAGGDDGSRASHEATRRERAAATAHRRSAKADRIVAAQLRSQAAWERDAMAARRDETARRRDLQSETTERQIAISNAPLAEKLEMLRARAAADRARAARDRAAAARERARLETELLGAYMDGLTGAHRREVGGLAIQLEIDRARRADGRFVLAFVDVDNLKGINDRDGHAAGDHVLTVLVRVLRSNLRSFDPIVRYGGDEFVCGLGGMSLEDAGRRFELIDRLVQAEVGTGTSVGLAALRGDETLEELTARADADLLAAKRRRHALAVE